MSIELFEHNRQAYDSAAAMLAAAGKACVIHPTGTGKSFIGFKLCEDNPEKTVCWLSPSDYIFRTQLENLAAAADCWEPENITFFTYAKLMNMTDSEIADIKPDYIILDEFHRCGAQMWGEGVQRLLAAFPDVPILGLSATAIRYLDDQRNMAEELFDRLEDTLSASWDMMYEKLAEYHKANGNVDVPFNYITEDFCTLGVWVARQRRIYNGKLAGTLTEEHINALNEIGMLWGTKKERQWEKSYYELCRYKKKYGNADVPASYISNGIRLYAWLDRQKRLHEKGSEILSADKIEKLEALGVEWEKTSRWEKNYQLAKKYYDENGSLNIQCSQASGLRSLQLWLNKQKRLAEGKENGRQKGKVLTPEQRKKLEAIGLFRDGAYESKWKEQYAEAKAYFSEHHDLNAAPEFIGSNGKKLYSWLNRHRNAKREGKLSNEHIKLLDAIGMVW